MNRPENLEFGGKMMTMGRQMVASDAVVPAGLRH